MSAGVGIVLALGAALLVWGIALYNRLVARKNHALEAWAGIDVQLKRRHDLLPKLADTVKAYAAYEQKLLHEVTEARGVSQRAQRENAVTGALAGLLAVAEAYPELKANEGFLNLQREVSAVEEQIQYARRYYNGTVREVNILVQSFPSNLVARLFGFGLMEFFEIELATQRESPELRL